MSENLPNVVTEFIQHLSCEFGAVLKPANGKYLILAKLKSTALHQVLVQTSKAHAAFLSLYLYQQ